MRYTSSRKTSMQIANIEPANNRTMGAVVCLETNALSMTPTQTITVTAVAGSYQQQ